MGYNEAETRFHLIDPVLRDKGYDGHQRVPLETPAPVEPVGFKGRRRKGGGRTDYLLCVQIGDMPKVLLGDGGGAGEPTGEGETANVEKISSNVWQASSDCRARLSDEEINVLRKNKKGTLERLRRISEQEGRE